MQILSAFKSPSLHFGALVFYPSGKQYDQKGVKGAYDTFQRILVSEADVENLKTYARKMKAVSKYRAFSRLKHLAKYHHEMKKLVYEPVSSCPKLPKNSFGLIAPGGETLLLLTRNSDEVGDLISRILAGDAVSEQDIDQVAAKGASNFKKFWVPSIKSLIIDVGNSVFGGQKRIPDNSGKALDGAFSIVNKLARLDGSQTVKRTHVTQPELEPV